MTAPVYLFIATKTVRYSSMPTRARSQAEMNRNLRNAVGALAGVKTEVGDLKLRSCDEAVSNHLLCDGSVLSVIDFPELAAYLGTRFGGDGVATFALPNYFDDLLAIPPLAVVQTVSPGGTVSTGAVITPPVGAAQTGGTTGGNVRSGGRPRSLGDPNPIQ